MLARTLAALFVLTLLQPTSAQQKRSEFVEGMFRSIFERQLNGSQQQPQNGTTVPRIQPRPQPGNIRPSQPRTINTQPNAQSNPATNINNRNFGGGVNLRNAVAGFQNQIHQLSNQLNAESARVNGLRPLMTDVWRVAARADAVSTLASRNSSGNAIQTPYCELDADYRSLSYKLRSLRGLSPQAINIIQSLDNQSDQLCTVMGVQPQFNRERLLEQMLISTSYMDTLLDDLEFDHAASPDFAKLQHDGRLLQERLRLEAVHARTHSYDSIVSKFSTFVSQWREYSARLYALKNARINRRLARIRASGSEVFAALWMPAPSDRTYLQYAAQEYGSRVNELLDSMSVRTLVSFPAEQQQQILQMATGMALGTQSLAQSINNSSPLNVLRSEFQQIDDGWRQLGSRLTHVTAKPVISAVNAVNYSHNEFSGLLRYRRAVDTTRLLHLASAMESLAVRLHQDIHLYSNAYQSTRFRTNVFNAADTFYHRTENFYRQVASKRPLNELQQTVDALLSDWKTLTSYVSELQRNGLSSNRTQVVMESYQELAPMVAEVAGMLAT